MIAPPAFGDEPPSVSAHAVVRTGGWLGFATAGIGIGLLDDHIRFTATYGFVPAAIGGENLHEVSFGSTVRMTPILSKPWSWVPLYGGIAGLVTLDGHTFVVSPSRYPPAYYAPTAVHVLTEVGTEIGFTPGRGALQYALFVELVGLGRYWAHWVGNPRVVDLAHVVSPSVGLGVRW